MKKCLYTLIFTLLMSVSMLAMAKTSTLKFTISGVKGNAEKNASSALKDLEGKLHKPVSTRSVYEFYKEAPRAIKKSLQPYGYFRARILPNLNQENGTWHATFTIQPGTPIKITKVTLEIHGAGSSDPVFQNYKSKFPLKIGQDFNVETYDRAKQGLIDIANNRGYFDANMIKSKLIINLIRYRVHAVIIFQTGPRYRFGSTTLAHNPMSDHFIRKYLQYKQGEYYDYSKIEKTQQYLIQSGYFSQVFMKPEVSKMAHGEVPIHINLHKGKSKQYIIGVGYGTDTGFRGTLGVTFRRLNKWGHTFTSLLQASQYNSTITADYMIPGPRPAIDQFNLTAAASNIDQTSGTARNVKFAASYSTYFGRLQQIASLAYLFETYNLTGLPTTNAQLVYPSVTWKLFKADNKLNPNNGYNISLTLSGAPDSWSFQQSKSGFFQSYAIAKWLGTFEPTHTRLLLRGAIGHTIINNIVNLPLSLQLFAGGANSVRGYSYNSIGPGRNLAIGSIEVQQRVYGNFYIAGFADAGNVSDNNLFEENFYNDMNVGIGPAIVWLSPVGMLELSAAYPVTDPKRTWMIQFSMGSFL